MNKSNLLNLCWKELEPIVTKLGFILDDIEYIKDPIGNILRIYIDKDLGIIDIEDCEKASKLISCRLDELDPIVESYFLEVSSPGVDRPFKNERDYLKNIGNIVDIKFYMPINDKKEIKGKLVGFNEDFVQIETEKEIVEFDRKKIATIRLSIF